MGEARVGFVTALGMRLFGGAYKKMAGDNSRLRSELRSADDAARQTAKMLANANEHAAYWEQESKKLQSTLQVRELEVKELVAVIARFHAITEKDTEIACMEAEFAKVKRQPLEQFRGLG